VLASASADIIRNILVISGSPFVDRDDRGAMTSFTRRAGRTCAILIGEVRQLPSAAEIEGPAE